MCFLSLRRQIKASRLKALCRIFMQLILLACSVALTVRTATYPPSRRHRITLPRQSSFLKAQTRVILEPEQAFTSALLKISYDGGRFTGWSNANKGSVLGPDGRPKGFVRSIQGTIQDSLSRLYGNLPVVVEGCSRTDKGVHARCMIAQFYCYDPSLWNETSFLDGATMHAFSVPGKKQPHPWNATDSSYFKPLPTIDLLSIQYKLNRMLPADVRIVDIAPLPTSPTSKIPIQQLVFHPTLSSSSKTYQYTLSTGVIHDPTQSRSVWHVGDAPLNVSAMEQASRLVLLGRHDFSAFRGAPRSQTDRIRMEEQSTICNIMAVNVQVDEARSWRNKTQVYIVTVSGDRFLYKMVRFLVGALVSVGRKDLSVQDLRKTMEAGQREGSLFECAPAKGLVLFDVTYEGYCIDWLCQ